MKRIIVFSLLLTAAVSYAQFDALRTLTPEQGQDVRRPVEAKIFASTQEELAAHEAALLEIFQASDTTLEGKQYTCRMLRHCASEASVPVLEKELLNPELSQFVRRVLQGLKASSANDALIAPLPAASNKITAGIIGTLGQRGSEQSVKTIAPYLESENAEIQRAAITALGNIGGKKARKALAGAKVDSKFSSEWKMAQIKSAEKLKPRSVLFFRSNPALKVYKAFLDDGDENIRCAALVGVAKADADEAADMVLAELNSENARIRNTALGLLAVLPSDELVEEIEELDTPSQILVISELSDRKATEAETVVLKLAASENAAIKTAAFQALEHVGGAASIQPLIDAALDNADAYNALCGLNATGTDVAVIQALETTKNEKVKVKMLECLTARQAKTALPAFVTLAKGDWNRTSASAISGMASLVSEKDFSIYADMMLSTDNKKKIMALEKSIATAGQRLPDTTACALPLIEAYDKAKGEAKYAIIRSLGSIGGDAARGLLTQAMASIDPKIQDAAIRGLANWPSMDVAGQLLQLATAAADDKHRVIALRGYIRLAGTVPDFKPAFAMCQKALATTDRPAEIKSIISCAKRFKEPQVLDFLAVQLDNPEVFTEAGWAICEISGHWKLKQPSIPILQRIAETDDQILAKEAKKRIKDNQG
ncbi:HEAT repeat domain-containing protein [Pontiella sulfatireligans]|uniref:HEAT repeat domain-containing protein n=1 Tax=Pontiella sulfatireligans TaxID=2750658 RepID=A0A6C2UM28_9BACT|nr:HEAT repeat domain-containing protein [Pontiella sulfatireligans]VGO20166.1 hypothetical protein SCARR_02227 [Pontiella sulfatireligans]